jgi:lipopolysaccharide export LptBFGC system permease protein LptF
MFMSKNYSTLVLKISLVLSIFHLPGTAFSCAVCFSGTEESLQAYYLTTALLTLLPVLMVASIGYWIYRKHKEN